MCDELPEFPFSLFMTQAVVCEQSDLIRQISSVLLLVRFQSEE